MSDVEEPRSYTRASFVLSVAIAFFMVADLVEDWEGGLSFHHFIIEFTIVALAVAHGVVQWKRLRVGRAHARQLGQRLEAARLETERWRSEAGDALRTLGAAIDQQLERWRLTLAERQVALLLLKGLSHKEIANLRTTSEHTVRQQSLAVYRKSGLSGRNELSAFFLEDLLLPASVNESAAAASPGVSSSPGREA